MRSSFAAAAAAGVVLLVAAGAAATAMGGERPPAAAPPTSTVTAVARQVDPSPSAASAAQRPDAATSSSASSSAPSPTATAARSLRTAGPSQPVPGTRPSRAQVPAATGTTPPKPATAPGPKPPANDSYRKAVVVRSLPTSVTVDVAGATLDPLEAGLAADCGVPGADRAVWYRYDDPRGLGFVADASGSDHPVGLALLGGDPRRNVLMGCSSGARLTTSPGPTGPFYVAVLSDARDSASRVQVRFDTLEPAPVGTVTLDATGRLDSGRAVLTGSYSCTGGSGVTATISGTAAQGAMTGIASPVDLACDGGVHRWSLVVSGPAEFVPGTAAASVTLSTCRGTTCGHRSAEASVALAAGA